MVFGDVIHLRRILDTSGSTVDGCFELINADLSTVGKFHFKKLLSVNQQDTCFKVDALINGEYKNGFINLYGHTDLMCKLRNIEQKHTANIINMYFFYKLCRDIKDPKTIFNFLSLGIEGVIEQDIVVNYKRENNDSLSRIFNRIFLGETVAQKIDFYKKLKNDFEKNPQILFILDEIFSDGLLIKYFSDEILLDQIPFNLGLKKFELLKIKVIDAITESVRSGYNLLVDKLLLKYPMYLENAVITAAKYGNSLLIESFLKTNPEYLESIVVDAASNGHTSIVMAYLGDSSDLLEKSIEVASKNNRQSLIKDILSTNKTISPKCLGKVLVNLIKNTPTYVEYIKDSPFEDDPIEPFANELIAFLLEKENIPVEFLGEALIEASICNVDYIVGFIIKNRKVPLKYIEKAISKAATYGRESIVMFFLENVMIPSECLEKVVLKAAENGCKNVVQFLLKYINNQPFFLGQVVYLASINDNEDIIRFVLKEDVLIDKEYFCKSFVKIAQNGNISLIDFFLNSRKEEISIEDFGLVVRAAAACGFLNIVKMLISSKREILIKDLGQSVVNASKGGFEDIVKYILSEERTVDKKSLDLAIKLCSKLDILKFLLTKCEGVSLKALEKAINLLNHIDEYDEDLFKYLVSKSKIYNCNITDEISVSKD